MEPILARFGLGDPAWLDPATAGAIVLIAALVALVVHKLVFPLIIRFTHRTPTDFDSRLVKSVRWPITFGILVLWVYLALVIPLDLTPAQEGQVDTVGKALALSMEVDCLAFTGSTAVGKQLMQYAGQSNLKRVYLECGGKSPNLVFADCKDLDQVASHAAAAIFHNQGEVCIAGSRLLVENTIRDDFVERVLKAAENMQPGDPLDPDSFMGAIVDEAQHRRILDYIRQGVEEGARLRTGGQAIDGPGLFIPPPVFDGVTPQMTIGREEIFGPVLAVFGFDTEEEAVAMANDTPYGLAAGLWSQDIDRIMRVTRRLQSGQVFVNNWAGGDQTMPFGGVKQSGNGRDKSLHSLAEYSELKSVWMSLSL